VEGYYSASRSNGGWGSGLGAESTIENQRWIEPHAPNNLSETGVGMKRFENRADRNGVNRAAVIVAGAI
jgi:hypothetical protein